VAQSVNEVARHLGVAINTIYRWIDRKKLPAHRVARLWKFSGGAGGTRETGQA
jgi:excisionase family DNA binding protein